jgi:hypothetical protein
VSGRHLDAIARTVLYEGYLLYPYRPSAVKNRHRFNFGVLYPRAFCDQAGSDRFQLQAQCPVSGTAETRLTVSVRFLQLFERPAVDGAAEGWHEGTEREVSISDASVADLLQGEGRLAFVVPKEQDDSKVTEAIRGELHVGVDEVQPGCYKLTVGVTNLTALDATATRHDALAQSLVSAHVVINAAAGDLVSVLDPPDGFRDIAAQCVNEGVWPVLVGDDGSHDCVLASPIVLYDYPQIAPESPGDLFDGTEIDEILALRILTLTDEEKREARGADERARRILERTDAMPPEQWAKLHGAIRGLRRVTEGAS